MIIVQTFWPGFNKHRSGVMNLSLGWLSPLHHYISWALSVLQLKEHYEHVVLHTNDLGREFLVDYLRLPFSEVIVSHNKTEYFDPRLWALSKIKTYYVQNEPFIHVDGDIFIWDVFFRDKPDLLAQNIEEDFDYNVKAIQIAKTLNLKIPEYVQLNDTSIGSVNAGIFGGSDIIAIKSFCEEAFNFYATNKHTLKKNNKIDINPLNALVEQILFYYFIKEQKKEVTYFIKSGVKTQYYKGFVDFEKVPTECKFIHALGSYKQSRIVCLQMANALKKYHPEYYHRLVNIFEADYNFWILNNPISKFNVAMKNCV